jgi:hypothetical protein
LLQNRHGCEPDPGGKAQALPDGVDQHSDQECDRRAYDEPKYVEDEFARKTFTTKAKAVKEFVDFCVQWCGGDRAALEDDLAKEVEVTKVPAIDLSAKDMELKSLSRKIAASRAPKDDDDDDESSDDEGGTSSGSAGEKGGKTAPAEPKAPAGSDAPVTSITDDIGSS